MTTEPSSSHATDFRHCPDGSRHDWDYKGKIAQAYVCRDCDLRVTKRELKEATDA